MDILNPDELNASRVFLTEFDRVTYSQVAWTSEDVAGIKLNLERKLKLLLITKGHVVIPLSHLLESELAREIIGSYPQLFTSKAIVPTLRSDYSSAHEFLSAKLEDPDTGESSLYKGPEVKMFSEIIDETAVFAKWDIDQTVGWFKSRLLIDLQDSSSLLRTILRQQKLIAPVEDIVKAISGKKRLSRGDVYRIAKASGDLPLWELLVAYTDFIYYLGGAIAAKSEGVLPQENLMDFSLSDLAGGRVNLSEHQIFFKIFIDIVKASTSMHFPTDFLDAISIDDAIELHNISLHSKFVDKYNLIQTKIKEGMIIRDPDKLVLLLSELETYERELHEEFGRCISAELPHYLREKKERSLADILRSMATLIFPWCHMIESAKEIVISGLKLVDHAEKVKEVSSRISLGIQACDKVLDGRSIYNSPILLTFIDSMKKRYVEIIRYG